VTTEPEFKVTTFLKSNIFRALIGQPYLTYGMVQCLVTLTDL